MKSFFFVIDVEQKYIIYINCKKKRTNNLLDFVAIIYYYDIYIIVIMKMILMIIIKILITMISYENDDRIAWQNGFLLNLGFYYNYYYLYGSVCPIDNNVWINMQRIKKFIKLSSLK